MSETKSPAGTYPTWPATLPVDGELVTNDKLFTSASADLGIIGKLIDAVGYLKARSPQVFRVRTDGAGAVTLERRTPIEDGATAFFSSAAISGTAVRFTFGTALADDDDYAPVVQVDGTDQYASIGSRLASRFDVQVRDVSGGAAVDMATNVTTFSLVVFPNLAGYV